jgi:hypothetical protein
MFTSFIYVFPYTCSSLINKSCRRTTSCLSKGCFIEYNNAYLYEYIKLSQKGTEFPSVVTRKQLHEEFRKGGINMPKE